MKFSIIVPVYNVEKYVRQCLEVIDNQKFDDYEVICVDDCSTDNSVSIVEEFVNKNNRFRLIKQKTNQGVSVARNVALDNAKGEYVIFVDADDWLADNALEEMNKLINQSANADLIVFNHYDYDEKTSQSKLVIEKKTPSYLNMTPENVANSCGVLWVRIYKNEIIQKFKVRFPIGLIIEDDEFNWKYAIHCKYFYEHFQEGLYYYRNNREGSYTTEDDKNNYKRIEDEFKVFLHFYHYLVDNGLLRHYKKTILSILGLKVKRIFLKGQFEKVCGYLDNAIKEINFPQDYQDLKIK